LLDLYNNINNDLEKIIEINYSKIKEIIDKINQNYFQYSNNLSLNADDEQKKLDLLKKERDPENSILKLNNNSIFPKEIYNSISIRNKIITNTKKESELRNFGDESKLYPIKYEICNFQKSFLKSSDNSNPEIISNDIQRNLISSNAKNNNPSKKLKLFNVKKIIKKDLLGSEASNEIKVLKNKKVVYINTNLLNSYNTNRAIKKLNKIKFIITNKRRSKYRGVSKNGNKWQVLIMVNNKKSYLGSYPSEELAARVYDIYAIKSYGNKARTNFVYNYYQLKKIHERKINMKSNNISDFVKQLID
jgi:hypothetical protein